MSNKNDNHYFLQGGGEMGTLIRAIDWSKTSLGNPTEWPQSLRTMVAVMLDNPFGMYIAWGNDYIQLYNDGYRPILGSTKHPQALGISTKETFPEIWHIIESMFDGVMKGKAIGFPDLMLPLNRNGYVEECYFNFAYSPIRTDNGEVGGVLVTVVETSNKKKSDEALKESEMRFRTIADDAPVFIFLAGENAEVEYLNKTWCDYTGISSNDYKGRAWAEITHADDIEPATKIYMDGFNKRESCSFENRQKGVDGIYRTILWKATPRFSLSGEFIGMMGVGIDINERKKSEEKLRESELRFRLAIAGSKQFVFSQDKNLIYTWIYNPHPDFKADDIIGKTDEEIYVPSTAYILKVIKKKVLDSGTAFNGDVEIELYGKKVFYTMHIEAITDKSGRITGIIGTVIEITERIRAQQKIEESEQRFQAAVKAVEGVLWTNNSKGEMEGEQLGWAALTGQTYEEYKGYGWTTAVHLDDAAPTLKAWKEAVKGRRTFIFEHRLKTKDGQWRDFSIRAIPLLNPDGTLQQWVGVHTDITDKKQAVKALKDNEEKLNIVIEASELGTWEIDLKTGIVTGSSRFNEIMNYQHKNEVTLNDTLNRLHPKYVQLKADSFKKAHETGVFYFSGQIIWDDHSLHWVESKGKVFYDEQKNPIKIIGTTADITEEKHQQQILSESEERFRTLAQSLPQLVWITDGDGNFEFGSNRWLAYTGVESGSEGEWEKIIHPDDIDKINAEWNTCLKTGKTYSYEVRIKSKNGYYRWHSVIGEPIKNKENKIVKWVGAFTDIQDQKIKEEKKDEFISIASHEMKTPLTTAKAYLHMLENMLDQNNDKASLYAKKAKQSVNRLNVLASELLDVSKISFGKLNYTITNFNFNDMIESTVENMQLTSTKHCIIKTGEVKDNVTGDEDRLQQVLINLLTNAIKYSPGGEKVFVHVEQNNENITVSVKDMGIGIAQQSLDKIFEKYHRVEEHSVHFQGLGIGLFICYEIIERHHGKLWAESEPGKGSTFYFTIPVSSNLT